MRVPVDLVTGFLGSGKTTLIKRVLETGLDGQRVAVIVNELAGLGIDGRVLRSLGNVETMVELDNGCICCSVDLRFEYAVQEIVDSVDPDLVLIEATGVADPRLLIEKLARTRLILDAVVTVVDGESFEHARRQSEVVARQVAAADFLVISRVDVVTPERLARLSRRLTRLNRRALQLHGRLGEVEPPILFGTAVKRYRRDSRAGGPSPHPDHLSADGIDSFTCEVAGHLDRERFERFARALPRAIYRAKGFVWFSGESVPSLFNFTCGRCQTQWLPTLRNAPARAQTVFIGRSIAPLQERVQAGLHACRAIQS
jgi:cobalamin biosynthesis protein CobW